MQAVWPQSNILQIFVSTTYTYWKLLLIASYRTLWLHDPHGSLWKSLLPPITTLTLFWCVRPCLHQGFLRASSGVICTSYKKYREDLIISRGYVECVTCGCAGRRAVTNCSSVRRRNILARLYICIASHSTAASARYPDTRTRLGLLIARVVRLL